MRDTKSKDQQQPKTAWEKLQAGLNARARTSQEHMEVKTEKNQDLNQLRMILEYLDKNCLSNPAVGQLIFEQFVIHMILLEKRLLKSKNSAVAQSSFTLVTADYTIRKID